MISPARKARLDAAHRASVEVARQYGDVGPTPKRPGRKETDIALHQADFLSPPGADELYAHVAGLTPLTADGIDHSRTSCFMLMPDADTLAALSAAYPDHDEPFHMTVLYCGEGDVEAPDITTKDWMPIAPVTGVPMRFSEFGDSAYVLELSAPDATALRESLMADGYVNGSQYDEHKPHVTVGKVDMCAPAPVLLQRDLRFDTLRLCVGDETYDYPISPVQTFDSEFPTEAEVDDAKADKTYPSPAAAASVDYPARLEVADMPWHIDDAHPDCGGGYAVVKDEGNELVHCHEMLDDATEHMRALYAGEGEPGDMATTEEIDPITSATPVDVEELNMIQCPHCGATVQKGIHSCPECGASLDQQGEEPVARRDLPTRGPTRAPATQPGYAVGETSVPTLASNSERAQANDWDWEGVIVKEGVQTGDRRFIDRGALTWRELPLPLTLQTVTPDGGGHTGAVLCGSIWQLERIGDDIVGRGFFDSGEHGQEARRLITEKTLRGVSADIDSVVADMTAGQLEGDEPMLVFSEGRVMGATLTPFPALQECSIHLFEGETVEPALVASGTYHFAQGDDPWPRVLLRTEIEFNLTLDPTAQPLVADGKVRQLRQQVAPVEPPMAWFDRPQLSELTPVVVTKEGQVYGHVSDWTSCHIGFGNRCVTAPRSLSNYAHFYGPKAVLTAEGVQVATGPVYLDCDHADLSLNEHQAKDAMAHTGTAVADVHVYEDQFGICIAGALRPDASPAEIRALRGSDISPDWRPINRQREMVGLVVVNTSGFITPRQAALVASGKATGLTVPADGVPRVRWDLEDEEPTAMVAVGIVRHEPDRLEVMEQQLAAVRDFMVELRAERALARFGGPDAIAERQLERLRERRDAALARVEKALDPTRPLRGTELAGGRTYARDSAGQFAAVYGGGEGPQAFDAAESTGKNTILDDGGGNYIEFQPSGGESNAVEVKVAWQETGHEDGIEIQGSESIGYMASGAGGTYIVSRNQDLSDATAANSFDSAMQALTS